MGKLSATLDALVGVGLPFISPIAGAVYTGGRIVSNIVWGWFTRRSREQVDEALVSATSKRTLPCRAMCLS